MEADRMSDVILVNRTKRPRRMLVLNLTKKIAAVQVENRTTEETRQGDRRKRISTKMVADSIRIVAGGRTEPLPVQVLSAPDVKAAIASRDVRVEKVRARAATAPKPRRKKTDSNGGVNA